MDAYLNAALAQALLTEAPSPSTVKGKRPKHLRYSFPSLADLLTCLACFGVELEEEIETALTLDVLKTKVQEGHLDLETLHLFRSIADGDTCPYYSFIVVGILTQLFMESMSWRCLELLFREETWEDVNCRQHIGFRRRRLKTFMEDDSRSLHVMTKLECVYPRSHVLNHLNSAIDAQETSTGLKLEMVRQRCLHRLHFYKLSAKSWSIVGACPFHPSSCRDPRSDGFVSHISDEILHRAVYCNDDLKMPYVLPRHLQSAAEEARVHIQGVLEQLTRSLDAVDVNGALCQTPHRNSHIGQGPYLQPSLHDRQTKSLSHGVTGFQTPCRKLDSQHPRTVRQTAIEDDVHRMALNSVQSLRPVAGCWTPCPQFQPMHSVQERLQQERPNWSSPASYQVHSHRLLYPSDHPVTPSTFTVNQRPEQKTSWTVSGCPPLERRNPRDVRSVHPSTEAVAKLAEISEACQQFMTGAKVGSISLGQHSNFIHSVLNNRR